MVHRDLKPENILLTQAGVAKIADFGLGQKTAATVASAVYSAAASMARRRSPLAKLDYMSPEQRRVGRWTRADLYAAAVVLFELLTGRARGTRRRAI